GFVEHALARAVVKVGEHDYVPLCKRWPGTQVAKTSKRHSNDDQKQSRNHKSGEPTETAGIWLRDGRGRDFSLSAGCSRSVLIDRVNETIALARQCLNVSRGLGALAQGIAQTLNGSVETGIEIDERIGRPKLRTKLFPRNNLPGRGQQ